MIVPNQQHIKEIKNIETQPNLWKVAFTSGIWGACMMTVLMAMGIWMHLSPLGLEMTLGTLITGNVSIGSWALGFVWHLLNGGVFALAYAAIFRIAGKQGPGLGAILGIVHWFGAALLIRSLPDFHPLLHASFTDEAYDFYLAHSGPTFPGSLILHMVFGTMVGALCRNAVRRNQLLEEISQFRKAS